MEKDRPLIEAAHATDQRIASLDDRVPNHLKEHALSLNEVASICWVNPNAPNERSIAWLESGAPNEKFRILGYVGPRSKE
jgi:hypothetical protein